MIRRDFIQAALGACGLSLASQSMPKTDPGTFAIVLFPGDLSEEHMDALRKAWSIGAAIKQQILEQAIGLR